MRKVSVLVVLVTLCALVGAWNGVCFGQAEGAKGGSKMGMTVIPSFSEFGLGIRGWANPTVGYDVSGGISWNGDRKRGLGKLLYAFSTNKWRWYALGGGGYWSFSFDEPGFSGSASGAYFMVGLGAEKLLGIRKNHGIAFELGYPKGTVSMEATMNPGYGLGSYTTKLEQDYPAPYIGGAYTYYFK